MELGILTVERLDDRKVEAALRWTLKLPRGGTQRQQEEWLTDEIPAYEWDMPTPTISEVKVAIKQLKSNKVPGKDGIGAG